MTTNWPVRRSDSIDIAELQELARKYPFREFRRHRSVDGLSDRQYLSASIMEDLDGGAEHAAVGKHHGLSGIALLKPLEWETRFFEIPMASLRVIVGPRDRDAVANRLFQAITPKIRAFRHLTLRLDSDDFAVRSAAEDHGFRIMDTLCTYEYHKSSNSVPKQIEGKYSVRSYQPGDEEAILQIASTCFNDYPNRFYLDPLFGPEASRRLYQTWAEKCCSGEMVDDLFVAEFRGHVIGFLGFRVQKQLYKLTGIRLHGGGLGGCMPTRCNAYYDLLWNAIQNKGGEPGDFDTHLGNNVTINTYQSVGLHYVRARHTLHLSR